MGCGRTLSPEYLFDDSLFFYKNGGADKILELWETAKAKLRGHYNYYGGTDNLRGIVRFGFEVQKLLFKWLNRRGKNNCLNGEKFKQMLKRYPLPKPRIRVRMFEPSVNRLCEEPCA